MQKSCYRLLEFFFVAWYVLIAHWSRWVTVNQVTWVWFQQGAETLCSPSAILNGTEPVNALTLKLLYCCALSLSILGFHQWWSCVDRVLTLNMNIWLPISGLPLSALYCCVISISLSLFFFFNLVRTQPHVLAWHSDKSYCIASDQFGLKSLGHSFALNCLKY